MLYLAKRFQIQNDHAKSPVIKRSLCVLDHENDEFLQLDGKYGPIDFLKTVSHVRKTLRGQFSIVAVQEKVQNRTQCTQSENIHLHVEVLMLLMVVK